MRLRASIIALSLVASGAIAQIDQTSPDSDGRVPPIDHERIVELIDQLASADWATRQRAEQFLLLTPNDELAFIERTLGQTADMPAEQRIRLERVGARVFRRLPHAAMGIRFASSRPDDTPEILEPLRDFDAYRVLRAGDVVTAMGGVAVHNVADLRAAIISHEPNEHIEVEVVRGERIVKVSFKLGAYAALQNSRLADTDVDAAWQWRIARSAARVGQGDVANSAIVPQFEPLGEVPVRAAARNFSPTIYQLGAAVASAAGQPLATANASPYRPSGPDFGRRGRRGTGNANRNRDEIIVFENQIAANKRKISLLEQRISAIDDGLKMPHEEPERTRLTTMRSDAAQQITALTMDSARLSRFLEALKR